MINIVQIGLGPLGQIAVRFALERGTIRIVGAVDPAPDKAGQDLGVVCGLKPRGLIVQANLAAACRGKKPVVAVLTTVSSLSRLEPQVRELAEAGLHIVSTCEELAFPWKTQPRIAKCKGREVLKLHFRAAVGERESFDRVEIDGKPSFTSLISGGINGDIASCAITINAIRAIVKAAPGLRTMIDLPPVGFTSAF